MDAIFIKILNMSIVASWVIIAVIILRLVLKKAPKWIRCVMWLMVAIRLIFPFSFESRLSLVPNAQIIDSTSYSSTSYINSGIINYPTNAEVIQTTESSSDMLTIISSVWLAGVVLMLGYMLFSYVRIHRKVSESIILKDNIRLCDHIQSPFVLGVFRPQIYLLSSMSEKESEYVIAHEQAHLKRLDNIWKPLGFVLLSIYWFNPLCWIAYWLFNKDIEFACDEKVVRTLDTKGKKAYSTALLSCSINRHTVAAYPLSFGEVDVKQRIKSVLSYEKPAFYVMVTAIAFCMMMAVSFMTDPLSASAANAVVENIKNSNSDEKIISVNLADYDITQLDINIVYSIINDKLSENESEDIKKVELDEENREIRVHIKNLDSDKEKWFRENICDSSYIVFVSVIEETKPVEPVTKPTEPATVSVAETQTEDSYTEDYYDDSYYYDSYYYEESYSDDSYSDNSDFVQRLVEIQPFELTPGYETEAYIEENQRIFREIELSSNDSSQNNNGIHYPIVWDIASSNNLSE